MILMGLAVILLAVAVFVIDKHVTSVAAGIADIKTLATRVDSTTTTLYIDSYNKAKADAAKVTSVITSSVSKIVAESKELATDVRNAF